MASTRGTRTRPLRSETRRRVLDAAAEVFAARGIASSSVSDIAASAGLTKGAVYSNFDSKDDLVLALMEENVLHRLHNAMAAFDAAEDVNLAVHDLGASLVDAIHTDLTWQHLLFEYCVLARRDPELHAALAARRREGRAAVARAIDRIAAARGVALPMSAEDLAVAMLAVSNGLALETGMDAGGVPDDLFPRLIALIVDPSRSATRSTPAAEASPSPATTAEGRPAPRTTSGAAPGRASGRAGSRAASAADSSSRQASASPEGSPRDRSTRGKSRNDPVPGLTAKPEPSEPEAPKTVRSTGAAARRRQSGVASGRSSAKGKSARREGE